MENATLCKWGNSEAIRIPKSLSKALGLEVGDSLNISVIDNGLFIKPAKKKKRFSFDNFPDGVKVEDEFGEARFGIEEL